jgi:hypothetical protein
MKMFTCACKGTLFFDNTLCLQCCRETGWCPGCRQIAGFDPPLNESPEFVCATCKVRVLKCKNNHDFAVCNRYVLSSPDALFCNCCRFNRTIPDLKVAGNGQRWRLLEAAKRRLFYDLEMLNLPYGTTAEGFQPGLSFDFKTDKILSNGLWQRMNNADPVMTGHTDGLITINICEADDVERERTRVNLREPQRTLIGHFRHEIAHYYWDLLIKNRQEPQCGKIFGDHTLDYATAQQKYYANGAPPDWQNQYVSPYATMHPWEDFAETFALYLDVRGTLDTADAQCLLRAAEPTGDLEGTLKRYARFAVGINEINRHMGLPDLVPEVFCPGVVTKMNYIHDVVKTAAEAHKPPSAEKSAQLATAAA